jgi:hypothetical protein
MESNRVDVARATVVVEPARARQTERSSTPFREVLATSVDVLMTGAEVTTGLVGGPALSAAVHGARKDLVGTLSGNTGSHSAGVMGARENPSAEMAAVHAMQRESQAFNLQLLALQEEIQQENRRFSTLSNVLRARHDTAKAAISNIRG